MLFPLLPALALAAAAALPSPRAPGAVSGKVTATAMAGAGRPWLIYVENGPAQPAEAASRREMTQKDSLFAPGTIWVRAGDSIDFVNNDNVYHNVFSTTRGAEFDLGLYRGGVKKSVEMRQPGEVDVYCNIHPQMRAKVLVIPSAQAVEAGADGSYSLEKLPPGSYTLVAWTSAHEPARKQIEVKAGETARTDFSLQPRAVKQAQHLNKNGEQYGRYK
jgi:plastocyanin